MSQATSCDVTQSIYIYIFHRVKWYIRLMHESAIGVHDQWLPRCRSNIGIGNEIVGSFSLLLNSMALYSIWNMLCNLISE